MGDQRGSRLRGVGDGTAEKRVKMGTIEGWQQNGDKRRQQNVGRNVWGGGGTAGCAKRLRGWQPGRGREGKKP